MVPIHSVEELFQLSGVRATDLHKENIDHITIPSKQGKGTLHRIDEVRSGEGVERGVWVYV